MGKIGMKLNREVIMKEIKIRRSVRSFEDKLLTDKELEN